MKSFLFGCGTGSVPREEEQRIRRALREAHLDVDFIYASMPEGPRFWFAARNLGEPFDSATRREVERVVGKVQTGERLCVRCKRVPPMNSYATCESCHDDSLAEAEHFYGVQ